MNTQRSALATNDMDDVVPEVSDAEAAIETLTRYQAKELGARGIAVNVVAPGAIETDFGGGRVRDNKEMNDYIASQTALGRVGLPDDIGPVVAFLCTYFFGFSESDLEGGKEVKKVRLGKREPN